MVYRFESLCEMVQAIVVGVVISGLATLGLRRRDARAEEREARTRERLAAIVLYEEIKSVIDAIDLALHDDSPRWLVSMSESTMLIEAWREQALALQGLGTERWHVLSDAVSAVAPSAVLVSASARAEDLRRSLIERRELLVEAAEIVVSVRDRRKRSWSRRSGRLRSLMV